MSSLLPKIPKLTKLPKLPSWAQVIQALRRHRKALLEAGVWLVIIAVVFFVPQTRLTANRLIYVLSNRKPPAWVSLPKGAKIDVDSTERYKRQELAEFNAKMTGVGRDVLTALGLKRPLVTVTLKPSLYGWPKVRQDLQAAGNTFVEFWGVSILTYQGQTYIMGIVGATSTPINMSDNVLRWQKDIEASAQKYHVEAALVAAVIETESGGDPDALSPVGAIGLMQLMPGTAASLGVNPYDPAQNIDGGTHYLEVQLQHFGSLEGALAAYNAGPGEVASGNWVKLPETLNYVQKVPMLQEKYERIWAQHAAADAQRAKAREQAMAKHN